MLQLEQWRAIVHTLWLEYWAPLSMLGTWVPWSDFSIALWPLPVCMCSHGESHVWLSIAQTHRATACMFIMKFVLLWTFNQLSLLSLLQASTSLLYHMATYIIEATLQSYKSIQSTVNTSYSVWFLIAFTHAVTCLPYEPVSQHLFLPLSISCLHPVHDSRVCKH